MKERKEESVITYSLSEDISTTVQTSSFHEVHVIYYCSRVVRAPAIVL